MTGLLKAARFLLLDILSSLVFAGIFALTHSLYLAAGLGVAIGLGQIGWALARGQRPDAMQWMSLGLILVFGAATLFTHNGVFIKIKPALVYVVVGVSMCAPGWMTRYMPPIVMDNAPEIPKAFGFVWAGLMFCTAAATLIIAFRFDDRTYAAFLATFPLTSKLVLFGLQYALTRTLVRRRMRGRGSPGPMAQQTPLHG